jgi:hypothetical protein
MYASAIRTEALATADLPLLRPEFESWLADLPVFGHAGAYGERGVALRLDTEAVRQAPALAPKVWRSLEHPAVPV